MIEYQHEFKHLPCQAYYFVSWRSKLQRPNILNIYHQNISFPKLKRTHQAFSINGNGISNISRDNSGYSNSHKRGYSNSYEPMAVYCCRNNCRSQNSSSRGNCRRREIPSTRRLANTLCTFLRNWLFLEDHQWIPPQCGTDRSPELPVIADSR